MKRLAIALLTLSSCGSSEEPTRTDDVGAPAVGVAVPGTPPAPMAVVLPIPEDKAQLERLVQMGYKVHDDHLDPPGVASCPKMADNPVM